MARHLSIRLLALSLAGPFAYAVLAACSLVPPANNPPTPTGAPSSIPLSNYEPQPGDDQLVRDQVYVELENSSLAIMESYPIQVNAILNGNLPDPCHQLRVVVTPADADKNINLEVYSVTDSNKVCITVLQPFTATIPLGSYTNGHYRIYVNGELLGEFDA